MVKHKVAMTVNKPAAEVFKFVGTDYFINHPKWDSRVENLQLESSGPVAVGTHGHETRRQGGRKMTYGFEVTDFKPGSLMAFKASGGPVKLTTSYAVKPLSDKQSQLEVEVNMRMGGLLMLMEPFMKGGVSKEFNAITAQIKKMIEEQR